jgi:hypothetical protein
VLFQVEKYFYMSKTKRERFEAVASGRVNKVLGSLSSLEKCSNPYNYEYNEEDVRKMLNVIKKQVDSLKAAFEKGAAKK